MPGGEDPGTKHGTVTVHKPSKQAPLLAKMPHNERWRGVAPLQPNHGPRGEDTTLGEHVVRESRTLRAMWRGLETDLRCG